MSLLHMKIKFSRQIIEIAARKERYKFMMLVGAFQ